MFRALTRALGQIPDPAFRRILLRSLAASIGVFVVLWVLAWLGLDWAGAALADWLAADPEGLWGRALAWLFGAASVVAVLFASFLLFPAVVVLVMSLMLEEIARAVEQRHYPDLPTPRAQPLGEALGDAIAFTATTVALNLVALPLYLLLFFLPPLNLFVFYWLNGYLLGREYFELVAARRLVSVERRRMRKAHRGRLLAAGVVIAFLTTLPLVNLVMPMVATGFMLHIFEGLRRQGP